MIHLRFFTRFIGAIVSITAALGLLMAAAFAIAPATPIFTFEYQEQLYVMDAGRGVMRPDGAPSGHTQPFVLALNVPLYRVGGPQWSPDGAQLAFHGRTQYDNLNIYTMDASGDNLQKLTRFQQGLTPALVVAPQWSPDGARIAFTYAQGSDSAIYAMNANGTNLQRLTPPGGDVRFGGWSPDSTHIAYLLEENISMVGAALYIVDANTAERTRLLDSLTRAALPRWSPDGTHLLFASAYGTDTRGELYTLEVATRTLTNLTGNLTTLEREPIWSPDGTHIIYTSSLGNDAALMFMIDSEGRNPRRLATPRGCFSLDWSPDGRYVTFQCGPPGRWSVYMMTVSTGAIREVLQQRVPYIGFKPAWVR